MSTFNTRTLRHRTSVCLILASILLSFGAASVAFAIQPPETIDKPDIDLRLPQDRGGSVGFVLRSPSPVQLSAATVLKAQRNVGAFRWSGSAGSPKWLAAKPGEVLSPAHAGPHDEAARHFLQSHAVLLGLSKSEVRDLEVTSIVPAADGGSHVYFKQIVAGIDVFGGRANVNLAADGSVRSMGSTLYSGIQTPGAPGLKAVEAARRAAINVYPDTGFIGEIASERSDGARDTIFKETAYGRQPQARLVLFPDSHGAQLAWEVRVAEPSLYTDYVILIDAMDGSMLFRHNKTLYVDARILDANAPSPESEELNPVDYKLVTLPASTTESPSGWIDAPGTTLIGNNASAHELFRTEPVMTDASGNYDYPYNTQRSSAVNAWYWANVAHDLFYDAGFNEAAGNYQHDNFGLGGLDGDRMLVTQWARGGRNNAFYSTSVDGATSGINFFWTDCRDCGEHDGYPENGGERSSGYMREVIIHEYGHGVSTRMVGGPATEDCLWGTQSGAMGEGWSDVFAAMFFDDPQIGDHFYEGRGFMRDLRHDLTYDQICTVGDWGCSVHNEGMIWAGTLWDLRKSMLALDSVNGRKNFEKIVVQGLASTACYPTFLDARDGILAADTTLNAGANHAAIWNAFASRGMGEFASSADEWDEFPVTGYTVPVAHTCTAPTTPTLNAVLAEGDNAIRLDFISAGSAVEIWRSDADNPFDRPTHVASTDSSTTFLDTDVQGGKTYAYTVVTLGSGGTSCRSAESTVQSAAATGTCDAFPILNPDTAVSTNVSNCELTVAWNAATHGCPASGQPVVYTIYRSGMPGFEASDALMIGRTASTTYVDTPPQSGETMYYMVLAQYGTLDDPPDHRERGSSHILKWAPGLATLVRTTAFSYDFESGTQGWSYNGCCDPGFLERAEPLGSHYGGAMFAPDESAGGSGFSFVTENGLPSPPSIANYDSDTFQSMSHPTFDGTSGATIVSFDYWAFSKGNNQGGIRLDVWDGTDWTRIDVLGRRTVQNFDTAGRHSWQRMELDLANYMTPTSNMTIYLDAINDGVLSEYGFDNVKIESGAVCMRSGLRLVDVLVDDSIAGGNSNGVLDPGETVRLIPSITNDAAITAVSPVGTLSMARGHALVHHDGDTFPDVISLDTVSSHGSGFTVTLPDHALCNEATTFIFEITAADGTRMVAPWTLEHGTTVTETVFEDDFETDKGWTVSGAARNEGIWQRVDPFLTMNGPDIASPEDCADGPGTLCYVTESYLGATVDGTDVDTVIPLLESPPLDLTGYKRARMFADLYYYDDTWITDYWDGWSQWGVYIPGDGQWSGYYQGEPTNGWVPVSLDMSVWMPNIAGPVVFAQAVDNSGSGIVEAGIDNVLIEGDRQVCAAGSAFPPNDVGPTLYLDKAGLDYDLSWTHSLTDGTHDLAAYYEIWTADIAGGQPFVDFDTATPDTFLHPESPSDLLFIKIASVNAAGSAGRPAP